MKKSRRLLNAILCTCLITGNIGTLSANAAVNGSMEDYDTIEAFAEQELATFSVDEIESEIQEFGTTESTVDVSKIFKDVSSTSWFHDAVQYVYDNSLMTGLNATTFGPAVTLSRAQFAVILWRMSGSPAQSYTSKFPDVGKGTWYTDAVLWANSVGVVTGYQNGKFGPADTITREQMALMMYRYAKVCGYDRSKLVSFDGFADASKVSSFAKEAMQWAVGMEIITGQQNGTMLAPQGKASRAECATIIMRFMKDYTEEPESKEKVVYNDDGSVERWQYGDNGELVCYEKTDADGFTKRYEYDETGELVCYKKIYTDGVVVIETVENGEVVRYEQIDADGSLTAERYMENGVEITYVYTYYEDGSVAVVKYEDGEYILCVIVDADGKLTEERYTEDGIEVINKYSYNSDGSVTVHMYEDGVWVEVDTLIDGVIDNYVILSYDDNGAIWYITFYDANGRKTSRELYSEDGTGILTAKAYYSYDEGTGNRTGYVVYYLDSDGNVTATYYYDETVSPKVLRIVQKYNNTYYLAIYTYVNENWEKQSIQECDKYGNPILETQSVSEESQEQSTEAEKQCADLENTLNQNIEESRLME